MSAVELEIEISEGWSNATVKDLTRLVQYGTSAKPTENSEGVPILRMGNIQDGVIDASHLKYIDAGSGNFDPFLLRRTDILFNRTNSPELVGKAALFDADLKAVFASYLIRLRCDESVGLSKFVCLWINSSWGRAWAKNVRTDGVSQSNINAAKLLAMPIPLPPLAEQKRIVAKVETLLAHVNAARQRLAKVPAFLKRFRQSVLAAACSGQLTEDWREAGGPLQFEQPTDERILPDIPTTWAWRIFGDLIQEFRNGIGTKPNPEPPGRKILRINAVRAGSVQFDDVRYMPNADDLVETYRLRNEDLLFTRYNGSLDLLGVCGMVRGLPDEVILYPDKLMRVRLAGCHVLPAYCEIFFSEPSARERMIAKSKSSAGQNGVSGSDVKKQFIAIPPLAEQHEIVRRVEALLARADRIEKRLATATRRVETLTQAILAQAFRGELVLTEAELARQEGRDYEPASVLLERIRDARDAEQLAKKGLPGSRKKS